MSQLITVKATPNYNGVCNAYALLPGEIILVMATEMNYQTLLAWLCTDKRTRKSLKDSESLLSALLKTARARHLQERVSAVHALICAYDAQCGGGKLTGSYTVAPVTRTYLELHLMLQSGLVVGPALESVLAGAAQEPVLELLMVGLCYDAEDGIDDHKAQMIRKPWTCQHAIEMARRHLSNIRPLAKDEPIGTPLTAAVTNYPDEMERLLAHSEDMMSAVKATVDVSLDDRLLRMHYAVVRVERTPAQADGVMPHALRRHSITEELKRLVTRPDGVLASGCYYVAKQGGRRGAPSYSYEIECPGLDRTLRER